MTTYEWLSLIVVLIGGFWTVTTKLGKIESAILKRVTYEECSKNRKECPCIIERNDRIRDEINQTRRFNIERNLK